MRLDASVLKLKGVGPKAAELLAGREILTVGDLLRFYPSEYDFFTDPDRPERFFRLSSPDAGGAQGFRRGGLCQGTAHPLPADRRCPLIGPGGETIACGFAASSRNMILFTGGMPGT